MNIQTCSVDGCDAKYYGIGFCRKHYDLFKRNGKPEYKFAPAKERFFDKFIPVTETGCWLWEGNVFPASNGKGAYGSISEKNKNIRAHRLSWEIHKGPIPKGMYVCHKCDTPECVNPEHLFIGTAKDNTQDALRKGRPMGRKPQ